MLLTNNNPLIMDIKLTIQQVPIVLLITYNKNYNEL